MKKLILSCLILFLTGICTNAQTYIMTNGTVSTCSGLFYDSGGASGNYANNENFTYTICATGGQCVRVSFTSFNIESGYDYLYIYNGPSTASPLIGTYTGTTSPGVITSTTGCLTFRFTSDYIITAPGWTATITCVPCGSGPVTASNCTDAVTVCTNLTFAVDPNGFGTINEICPAGTCAANPNTNPASSNYGCLLAGELNSTWLLVTITAPGTLEFSFGDNTTPYPQSGCYDWSMWPYSATACSQILAGTLAPIRCNWNSPCNGGTGIAAPANIPPGGWATNFEPPLTVTTGQQFVICFSNYSGLTTNVPLRFFGTAGIACTLPIEFLNASAIQKGKEGRILWKAPNNTQYTKTYLIEKQVSNNTWEVISNVAFVSGQTSYEATDKKLHVGNNVYRITQIHKDGGYGYAETIELNVSELPAFTFYPNPVVNILNLQLNTTQTYRVAILNTAGQLIYNNTVNNLNELQVDMSKFSAGNYWLRVNEEIVPFVKQ